jgi:hypothetical protein
MLANQQEMAASLTLATAAHNGTGAIEFQLINQPVNL